MNKKTKRWLVGGGLFLVLLPFVIVGAIAQLVAKYVQCGWELMGIGMDELEEWVAK